MRKKTQRRGLLLFSGGIDSALSAIILNSQDVELIALTINYPGRPSCEMRAAKSILKRLSLFKTCEVSLETGGPLTKYSHSQSAGAGWIPHRNLLFWAIAAHKAVMVDADFVAAGHDDNDGVTFSDASEDFFTNLTRLLKFNGVRTAKSLEVELPVYTASLEFLQKIAIQNREIIDMTWSCWRNGRKHCEACYACKEREVFLGGLR